MLTPEQHHLLTLTRGEPPNGPVHPANGRPLAWEALWELACVHGVGDPVGRRLLARDCNGRSLPDAVADRVKNDLLHAAAHAVALLEYQTQLADAFDQAGIVAVWLKGLALSQQLYGRPDARHCNDLDILLDAGDLPRAEAELRRFGLERLRSEVPGLDRHEVSSHHVSWGKEVMPGWLLVVEVHHKLSGPPACQPPARDLVRRSRVISLNGWPMRVPSREDELLLLCLHAHQHEFDFLRCLTDVADYVKKYDAELDWPRLQETAAACRASGRLRAALEVADRVAGLGPASRRLRELPALGRLQRWAVDKTVGEVLRHPPGESGDPRSVRHAMLMDRWRDALRQVRPFVWPPSEYVRAVCPAAWRHVPGFAHTYYLVRGAVKFLRRRAAT